MNDPDSEARFLRREMDRTYADRLLHLEQNTEDLERKVRTELASIHITLQRLVDCQAEQGPVIKSLNHLVGAGLIMRWVVIAVIGTLAAIGTAATAMEAMRAWLK
ncbi:MAG: hypothetical protein MUC53_00275 [Candidatus Contendobacter sp.]|jgi:predicted transcriptional regulator|nr:hypothetical protein [Candidatus Contendobacter sp.]